MSSKHSEGYVHVYTHICTHTEKLKNILILNSTKSLKKNERKSFSNPSDQVKEEPLTASMRPTLLLIASKRRELETHAPYE